MESHYRKVSGLWNPWHIPTWVLGPTLQYLQPHAHFSPLPAMFICQLNTPLNLGAQVFARRVESGDKPTWERVLSQLKPVAT